MPLYLDTRGKSNLAVAICDRCKMKRPYADLRKDGDNPGLRVCASCSDQRDPYKQAPRQTEKIALRYPRPDEDLE